MSCKRLSRHARAEQDYYLYFSDTQTVTKEERMEFLRYDSHGGTVPAANPIYCGKKRYGQTGEVLRDAYFDMHGGWIGGHELTQDYLAKPCGVRPLREWFGDETVDRWLESPGK